MKNRKEKMTKIEEKDRERKKDRRKEKVKKAGG